MDEAKATPQKTYRDLVVWQKAHAMTLKIFDITEQFPAQHLVREMMRESSASTAANIVVSYRKKNRDEKLHYLTTALDALEECRYYTILGLDLGLLHSDTADMLQSAINEVGYLLSSYNKSIAKHHAELQRTSMTIAETD